MATCDLAQTQIPDSLGTIVNLLNDGLIGPGKDNSELWHHLIIILSMAGIIFLGRIIWRLAIFYAARRVEAGLRQDMFLKAEKLPISYYRENKVGTVMNWFTSDVDTIGEYFGWGTVMLVDAFFLSVIVIIRMVRVDAMLTLLAGIPVILIVIWGALVERFMTKKWDEHQRAFDELYDFSQENFTGIRVIKAFVKENQEIRAFAKIAKKNRDVNYSFARLSVFFDIVIEIIIYSVIALLMGFGGWFIYATLTNNPIQVLGYAIQLDIGKLVTHITLFEMLIWPMIALGQIVTMMSRSRASLKRISRYLDAPEDVKSPENAVVLSEVQGKLEFRHFSFAYPDGDDDALIDLSFTIQPGERVGVVGKIGSGKSTLANILLRLYNFQEDGVFIDGTDLMKVDLTSLRDAIAYAPQDNFLFSDTVSNNIAFSSDEVDQDRVKEAADFADVAENVEAFPKGYETVSGERGVTLSGGQKQRISLARAYYKHAPILLMDDTVSAVDVKTEETILANLVKYREGKTTIVIASRVSTVRHFDKILVLSEGHCEAFGTHEELMKTSPTYERMVYLQTLEAEVAEGGNGNG